METILSALISGGLALIGVIITSNKTSSKLQHQLEINQAVTDTKIDELTREVREHNNFARRMPVVEEQIKDLKETVHDLGEYHKEQK